MTTFNAKQARAKRPCPLWVDAFQRDTQHLQADEVGAYFLILMAMWTRESCDFPDDDMRLARVARVSTRLWRSRIGPVLRPFFDTDQGALIQGRLRKEAAYVERQVTQQSNRKIAEKSYKGLKSNNPPSSADTSVEHPRNHPTQQPNNPTLEDRGKPLSRAERDRWFQEFWDAFPHRNGAKKDRAKVKTKWDRIAQSGKHDLQYIAIAAARYRGDGAVMRGYGKAPLTWLNGECWNDEIEPPKQEKTNAQHKASASDIARRAGERWARRMDSGPGADASGALFQPRLVAGGSGGGD